MGRPWKSAAALIAAVTAAAVAIPVVTADAMRAATTGAGAKAAAVAPADRTALGWHAAWRTAPQPPLGSGPSHDGFNNQTVRMIISPTVGGQAVRVHLSNTYGSAPLHVGGVAVADQQTGPIVAAATQRIVTFGHSTSTTIPAGAEAVSDPVPFHVRAGHNLAVSVHVSGSTGPATWHRLAQATSYVSGHGDWAAEPGGSPYQSITSSTFFLDGLDVLSHPLAGTVVAFGDSITDGAFSTIDAHRSYVEDLARDIPNVAFLNEGIGGNRILTDTPVGGPPALQRFQQDALDQPGVTTVILLEGVNDIGVDATAQQIIDGLTTLIDQAHARCVRIIGGTLSPFGGSVYDTPAHEQTRQAVNEWIRTSGRFDAVADFDRTLRDPSDPLVIDPRYHTVGDLHPNDRGYQAMADTIDRGQLAAGAPCTA
jgi:lysophospholipase L1-like esterase